MPSSLDEHPPLSPSCGRWPLRIAGLQLQSAIGGLRVGLYPHLVRAPLFPELAGDLERIDAGRLPPGSLDTDAVDRAAMHAAERHGEFVAWFATGLLRAWFWLRCKRLAHGHAQIGSRRGIRLIATLLPISDCSKPNLERGRETALVCASVRGR